MAQEKRLAITSWWGGGGIVDGGGRAGGRAPEPRVEELVDTSGNLGLYPKISGVLSKGLHKVLTCPLSLTPHFPVFCLCSPHLPQCGDISILCHGTYPI